jgi:hypothetical protein
VIARRHLRYRDPRPHSKIGKVRIALMSLLKEHDRDGALPTSVRFLFYELVSREVISKEGERPDKIVSEALTDLRARGLVPWNDIVDETRSIRSYVGSASVADDWLQYLDSACLDPWCGDVPMVLTESRSLAGVLDDMCSEFRIRIAPTNGQVGGFLHTDIAPLLTAGDRVLYLGDYDLAGNDIEANTRSVLENKVGELKWERLALTRKQVNDYNLTVIIKKDKRFKKRRFKRVLTSGRSLKPGEHEAVETEALSQAVIIDIVRRRLKALLPQSLDYVLVREEQERERLRTLIEQHGGDHA